MVKLLPLGIKSKFGPFLSEIDTSCSVGMVMDVAKVNTTVFFRKAVYGCSAAASFFGIYIYIYSFFVSINRFLIVLYNLG